MIELELKLELYYKCRIRIRSIIVIKPFSDAQELSVRDSVLRIDGIIDVPYQIHEIPKHSVIFNLHTKHLSYPLRAGVDQAFFLGGG